MASSPGQIEFNSTEFNSSGGVVVCVITACMGLMFLFGKTTKDDGKDWLRYAFIGSLFLIGLLLALYKKKIYVLTAGPSIVVKKGFWPFLRSTDATFAYASRLNVAMFVTQQGRRGYSTKLEYSDGRTLRLVYTFDRNALTKVVQLSRIANIPVEVTGGLRDRSDDPAWDLLGLTPPLTRP